METPLQSFEPYLYGVNTLTIVFLTLTLLFAIALFFQNKKKVPYYEKNRKRVFSMLLFFGLLIFGVTGILNLINTWKLKTVKFYNASIETPQGNIKYDDIQSAYIFMDKPLLINQNGNQTSNNKNKRMLIIEEYNRKTHVLSEENYPIENILELLNQIRKKKESK